MEKGSQRHPPSWRHTCSSKYFFYLFFQFGQAYRKIADKDRKSFINNYAKFGLKNLTLVGEYTKSTMLTEQEEDLSIKGMMTTLLTALKIQSQLHLFLLRPKILSLNRLETKDYGEAEQQEILESLLKESENFWGHERNRSLCSIPELNRWLYRTMVESKDSCVQKVSASVSSKDLKAMALW